MMTTQITKSISAAIALSLLLTAASFAQTFSVPKKLPLDPAAKREFRKWFRTPNGYPGLEVEKFFPVGWSRDGKFAYYYEPVDEACGCYFARLVIQDMRTDKVLWKFKYNQDADTDPKTGEMRGPGKIATLWQKNQKLISDKLGEHRIVASRATMLGNRFTIGGRYYTAKAIVKMGKSPDYGDERVEKLTFTLTAPKLATKTLATIDHSKEQFWNTLDGAVLGAIKSPFENRIAVIGMEINRGWEGPPHTGDIRIVGADLKRGWGIGVKSDLLGYPPVWFAPVNDPKKPVWEILPHEAKAGEVILSKRNEPGILSNFAATPFEMDGKRYASVEGFWQMMLYPEGPEDERAKAKGVEWKFTREQVAQMTAFEAKSAGTLAEQNMKKLGIDWVTYQGKRFPYRSATPGEHHRLIVAAMRAKLNQNSEVKRILLATGDLILKPDHHGEEKPPPEWKYYEIWMQLRSDLQKAGQKDN